MVFPKFLMESTVRDRWLLPTAIMFSLAPGGCSSSMVSRWSREVEKLESSPVLNLQFSSEMRDSIRTLSRGSTRGSMMGIQSLTTVVGLRLSSEAGNQSL